MDPLLSKILVKTFRAHQSVIRPKMAEIGLSPGQPIVLTMLTEHNNILQKDLADLCDIEPATISKLLVNMETDGLILRSPVPGDRRATCISITEKGREIQKQFHRISEQVRQIALDGFTPQEQQEFLGYLTRIYGNLTQRQ